MEKIENLTDSQEKLMAKIADDYEHAALCGDDSYNPDEIIDGIDFMYALSELKPPQIVICESPLDMKVQAGLKKGETFDPFGSGYDSGWTAFYDFFNQIGIEYDKEFEFEKWKNFITKSGVFACLLFENAAFVCIRPCEVYRNSDFNLHNEKGMAIKWRDGYGEYFLNGVAVDEKIVMTPAENLDPQIILKEKNAEIRREIVRKIGVERICQSLSAEVIDQFEDYELLMLNLGDDRKRPYLKMKNPSIGTFHIEGVHPKIKTCKEALAWRNGDKEYIRPDVLT